MFKRNYEVFRNAVGDICKIVMKDGYGALIATAQYDAVKKSFDIQPTMYASDEDMDCMNAVLEFLKYNPP